MTTALGLLIALLWSSAAIATKFGLESTTFRNDRRGNWFVDSHMALFSKWRCEYERFDHFRNRDALDGGRECLLQ